VVPYHDPRREVEKLTDHLAAHDRPLAFLIGAGASCAVRDEAGTPLVPAVEELGSLCAAAVAKLGGKYQNSYGQIVKEIGDARGEDEAPPNIEDILSAVRRKISAMGGSDALSGATKGELEKIEATLRKTIAEAARPAEDRIPDDLPHHALAQWIGRIDRAHAIEIFTTNYDTLLERSLEDERVPVFDGFVGSRAPFFSSTSLVHDDMAPGKRWARLWKIHGSTNWSWVGRGEQTQRIVRGDEHGGGELILPSYYKYDESRKQPYVAMLDRLTRVLTSRDNTVLIVVGYSFGDQHINEILFDAVDVQERLHIVALQYSDPPLDHVLIVRARRRKNILVYSPNRAVVGGVVGGWRLIEPVDERTADLLDVPFDSDAEPEAAATALTGKFRLGDFNWFGRFLTSVTGSQDRD
jgi:hypothetical protein